MAAATVLSSFSFSFSFSFSPAAVLSSLSSSSRRRLSLSCCSRRRLPCSWRRAMPIKAATFLTYPSPYTLSPSLRGHGRGIKLQLLEGGEAGSLPPLYPRLGFYHYVAVSEEASIAALKRALGALNTHLASSTYLVGHSVTLADIVMACNLYIGFARIMTKSFTAEFPHVERYFWTMVNQPNIRKVMGDVKQAESVPPVQKRTAAPKEQKPKEAKKEAKEAPKPKSVEKPDEEEEAPKPKPKNPLDLLPPSKMILDDWKKLYSNTKTNFREVAIKGFWDMYDPEGYSLWFCDYKYDEENTVSYVTLNKVGGFLQRMDLCRKYAFGKMLVIGSEAPFKVKGLWLFRGTEIPKFVLEEVYDMDLYEWTKVDISDEAQKERASAMIEDLEPFDGEALLDAKCFK